MLYIVYFLSIALLHTLLLRSLPWDLVFRVFSFSFFVLDLSLFIYFIRPWGMNTRNLDNSSNTACVYCQCNINSRRLQIENVNSPERGNYICSACIAKHHLPFHKVNNNELFFMFVETFKEVIKKFQNLPVDYIDNNDNIEYCRYDELEDVKKRISSNAESNDFSIMNINSVSIDANIDKIRVILYGLDSNPDIIAVSEARIHDGNFSPGKHYLRGYQKLIYDPAPSNGTPGGAGIFIKQGIDFTIRNDLKLNSPE